MEFTVDRNRARRHLSWQVVCLHCLGRPILRDTGLCQRCDESPKVKALYPVRQTGRRPQHEYFTDYYGYPPMPAEATMHEPGTVEKVRVMAARFERGESVFHPDDNLKQTSTAKRCRGQFVRGLVESDDE